MLEQPMTEDQPIEQPTNKPYMIQHVGETGIIIRDKNGHFMPGTKTHAPITHDNARTMLELRRDKSKAAALRAVNNAAITADIVIPDEIDVRDVGWYAMNNHAASILFMSDKANGIPELMRMLGTNTGHIEKTQDAPGDVTVSAEVRALIADIADIVRGSE